MKLGIYKHFKGNLYTLLHVAKHSETEEMMAVYHPNYVTNGQENEVFVRPLNMFDETIEREGKTLKRFSYVGNE